MKDGEDAETPVTLLQLFDKLKYMDSNIEEHFGSLQTEIASLRCELKDEIESVKTNMKDVEKSLEEAWAAIGEIQEEIKASRESKTKSLIARRSKWSK